MRLLIMGPPGAGKGTQATAVAERYQVPAISTGDIFRSNVADGTPLGLEVDRIMKSGGYVSDELTNQIVADRLGQDDARGGFLLDGYPRTLAQVEALDQLLSDQGQQLDGVISLDVDAEVLVGRLLQRAETEGRADDTEETIRVRQRKYAEETAPLLQLYADRGQLVSVDGLGTVDEVRDRIAAAVDSRAG